MDNALLATTFLSAIFAITFALIKIEKLEDFFFIEPTLLPLKSVEEQLSKQSQEKCPSCEKLFVKQFLSITLERIELCGNLGAIVSGLASQALIFFFSGYLSTFFSYLIYAFLPGYLLVNYVIIQRDVFSYWKRPSRFVLSLALVAFGVLGWFDPHYTDIVGLIWDHQRLVLSYNNINIYSYHIIIICLVVFVIFLLIRIYVHEKLPSLRTHILDELKQNPDGYTIDGLISVFSPREILWDREKILDCLSELVYQEIITINLASRTSEPKYKLIMNTT